MDCNSEIMDVALFARLEYEQWVCCQIFVGRLIFPSEGLSLSRPKRIHQTVLSAS